MSATEPLDDKLELMKLRAQNNSLTLRIRELEERVYLTENLADQRIKALDNATTLIHYLHREIIRLRKELPK